VKSPSRPARLEGFSDGNFGGRRRIVLTIQAGGIVKLSRDNNDVFETTEKAPRDRREHGKTPPRLDDDELERRAEIERVEVGVDDFDPDDVPPATD
jgi:hypothetical protein